MTQIGSQNRELIADSDMTFVGFTENNSVILHDGNKYELWQENDNYSGHVIVIHGIGYEFVRTATNYDLLSAGLYLVD